MRELYIKPAAAGFPLVFAQSNAEVLSAKTGEPVAGGT